MAESAKNEALLQFAPMQSSVDEGFWHKLSSLKLNKLGIDDSPIPIIGSSLYSFLLLSYSNFLQQLVFFNRKKNATSKELSLVLFVLKILGISL